MHTFQNRNFLTYIVYGIFFYCLSYIIIGVPYEYTDDLARETRLHSAVFDASILSVEVFVFYFAVFDVALMLLAIWLTWSIFRNPEAQLGTKIVTLGILSIPVSSLDIYQDAAFPELFRILFGLVPILPVFFIMYLIITFPDGKFVFSWTRWIPAISTVLTVVAGALIEFDPIIVVIVTLSFIIAAFFAQIQRYRLHTTPTQRQQTKWVLFGFIIFCGAAILRTIIDDVFVDPVFTDFTAGIAIYEMTFSFFLWYMPSTVLIVSFAIAIREQRLWDIELVANRSLVYSAVILVLGFIYIALVGLLLQLLDSENFVVAIIVSGLVPLTLFNRIRSILQRVIDHRLFGLRYDLNMVLEAQHELQNLPDTSRVVGEYPLLKPIGKGGMGEVYQTTYRGEPAAIKLLSDTHLDNNELQMRFQNEINILNGLHHPGIVKLLDFNIEQDTPFYIMNYVNGKSLNQLMTVQGKLPLDQALEIARDMAYILDYMHSKNIIHRDIKPANLMVQDDNRVVILDFGLSKIVGQNLDTRSNAVGTIAYMAPEQIIADAQIDKYTDIYALGAVLYEMIAGFPPFTGNFPAVLFSHLNKPVPDIRDVMPGVPEQTSSVIQTALAKSPQDRFATAGELAKALQI